MSTVHAIKASGSNTELPLADKKLRSDIKLEETAARISTLAVKITGGN